MKRTKIVCTIGPSTASPEQLQALALAGMDVVRLNFSHGSHEWHGERIAAVRVLEEQLQRPIAILQDLCGPKLRIGEMPPEGIRLRFGYDCVLHDGPFAEGPPIHIPLPIPELLRALQPGHLIYLDDAQIELVVKERVGQNVVCTVRNGGVLLSRKGINAPKVPFEISALTPKDLDDAAFGLRQGVDWMAVSFVRRPEDLLPVRELIDQAGQGTRLMAKIEEPEAVLALDQILGVVDAVMVARGDLGVSLPLHEVPVAQKEIIRKANALGKPVITATQMLESMIRSPRPTRAEVSDVANAIFDGTDAVMLSGETAMGEFPVEAVSVMAAVATHTEAYLPYDMRHRAALNARATSVAGAVSQGVAEIATDLDAAAILCSTTSGETARLLSQMRPQMPIIAATADLRTYRRLPLLWGVQPLLVPPTTSTDERMDSAVAGAVQAGWLKPGQRIVIVLGAPVGTPGHTNTFRVHTV